MKVIYGIIFLVLILGGGWFILKDKIGENQITKVEDTSIETKGEVVTPGIYIISTDASKIGWESRKPLIEGYVHHGTISLKNGSITVLETTATGTFTIDMNTISVTSLGGGKEGKESALEKHLKSADFFNVEKYQTGTFNITEVIENPDSDTSHNYTVKGSLTLLGVTNPVEFPSFIYKKDGMLKAEATLKIDRTKWNIKYGSGSFFNNLANNAIDDFFTLTLDITASSTPE